MGLRYRKSIGIVPGVRLNLSKSGVGYSIGRNGARITRRATGGVQGTFGVPGNGLSYQTRVHHIAPPTSTAPTRSARVPARPARPAAEAWRRTGQARRQAALAVPMPINVKVQWSLVLAGLILVISSAVAPPLVLFAVLVLVVGLVLSLVNRRRDRQWAEARRAAQLDAFGHGSH